MAFSPLGRTLNLTRSHRWLYSVLAHSSSMSQISSSSPMTQNHYYLFTQISCFRSSLPSSSSRSNIDDEISPDTILFEGCDYNHWLITMDFPKDPKPTPQEMVETYVHTLAKVVGSVEEAKKRMYACSTTTYTGFQAVMTEEMSEKFRGLPGVVFILPDSYIDPVNKEYGGDKYINGTIIPRPPPVQYSRQGRYGDRNRNRQGPPQADGRNYEGPRQNYRPPQNFGPSSSAPGDGRNYGGPQQNYGPPQNFGQSSSAPGDGRNYGGAQQNYGPNYGVTQQNYGPPQNFGPTGQGEERSVGAHQSYSSNPSGQIPVGNRDYVPERRDSYQIERSGALPSYQRNFPQAGPGDYAPPENGDFRGNSRGIYPPAGDFSQGAGSNYGQSYPVHGEGQRFPQGDGRQ